MQEWKILNKEFKTSELKILNIYKLWALLDCYVRSADTTLIQSVNNALIRKTFSDKLLKAENFSELDEETLMMFYSYIKRSKIKSIAGLNKWFREIKINNFKRQYQQMIEGHTITSLFSKEDVALVKKLGFTEKGILEESEKNLKAALSNEVLEELVKKSFPSKELIDKAFPSQAFLTAVLQNFEEDVTSELEKRRKKKSNKLVGDRSVDDSILMNFNEEELNEEFEKCKNLDEINGLFLYYTTGVGVDLINGFFRGDLTLFKSKKAKIKSSWGTPENVSVDVLINTITKALKLKKQLMFGTLDKVETVYRGLDVEGLLKFIKISKKELIGLNNGKEFSLQMLVDYINKAKPIYETKAITSTSLSKKIALGHASRSNRTSPPCIYDY